MPAGLRREFGGTAGPGSNGAQSLNNSDAERSEGIAVVEGVDPFRAAQQRAIQSLGKDEAFKRGLAGNGFPYARRGRCAQE